MACKTCGGRSRRTSDITDTGATSQNVTVNLLDSTKNLPLTFNGLILAEYIGGKGAGKHYYKGIVSKKPYKVQYGDVIYVDPRDVRKEGITAHPSLLVAVKASSEPVVAYVAPIPEAPPVIVEQEYAIPERTPVMKTAERVSVAEDLPDINNMKTNDILKLNLSAKVKKQLIGIEKAKYNRARVLKFLGEE